MQINAMQQKEYQIGEFFTLGKDTYKVIELSVNQDYQCEYCDFNSDEMEAICEDHECFASLRVDKKKVFFTLYDEDTEE